MKIDPKISKASTGLATIYFHLQEYDKSIWYFENTIRCHPNKASAYSNLGWAYFKTGQEDLAI